MNTDRDTLWLRVEPKTFLLTSNIDAAQFEWVVCTDEATDGSFNAAISTSVAMHTLKITRTGAVNGAAKSSITRQGLLTSMAPKTYIAPEKPPPAILLLETWKTP